MMNQMRALAVLVGIGEHKLRLLPLRLIAPMVKRGRAEMGGYLRGLEHGPRHLAAQHVEILLAELLQILRRHRLLVEGVARHAGQQAGVGAQGQAGGKALHQCFFRNNSGVAGDIGGVVG